MSAHVDPGQADQGDGAQDEEAAARTEARQRGGPEGDGHARVPGQVTQPAGVPAAAADVREQDGRPGPAHHPLDRFGQRPGSRAAGEEAACQLAVSGQPGGGGRRRDGPECAQLHDGPGGPVHRIGQAVDGPERPGLPRAHPIVTHRGRRGQQHGRARAELHPRIGQRGRQRAFPLARRPRHGLSSAPGSSGSLSRV
ncbi:MAG: hypothetical protein JO037_23030 [Actinobacteria bacterium]|nr:hypothetical protein [Actinomycetota bacterium]